MTDYDKLLVGKNAHRSNEDRLFSSFAVVRKFQLLWRWGFERGKYIIIQGQRVELVLPIEFIGTRLLRHDSHSLLERTTVYKNDNSSSWFNVGRPTLSCLKHFDIFIRSKGETFTLGSIRWFSRKANFLQQSAACYRKSKPGHSVNYLFHVMF